MLRVLCALTPGASAAAWWERIGTPRAADDLVAYGMAVEKLIGLKRAILKTHQSNIAVLKHLDRQNDRDRLRKTLTEHAGHIAELNAVDHLAFRVRFRFNADGMLTTLTVNARVERVNLNLCAAELNGDLATIVVLHQLARHTDVDVNQPVIEDARKH